MEDLEERIGKAANAMAGIVEEEPKEEAVAEEPEEKTAEEPKQEEPAFRKITYEPDNSKWKAYRKQMKELKAREREFESKLALLDEDPEEFLRASGKDPEQVIAKLTKRAIQNDDPVLRELNELKREVRQQKPVPEVEEEPDIDDHQERFLAVVQQAANDGYAINGKGELLKLEDRWPSLASLHPMDRAMQVRGIVTAAIQNAPHLEMEDVLDRLEQKASEWVQTVRGQETPRQPEQSKPEPAPAPEAEQPDSVRSAPEPEKIKRRPSNTAVPMELEDRIKRAARAADRR